MAKIGKHINPQMSEYDKSLGFYIDKNYIVLADDFDFGSSPTYTDATSIKNWDYLINKVNYDVTLIRKEIETLVQSIGWNNLSTEEKAIASRNFCVSKALRDEVFTDEEQSKNIKRLLNTLEINKSRVIKSESDNLYTKDSTYINDYLDNNYTFITPYYFYSESDSESVTNNPNSDSTTLELVDVPAGKYKISWTSEFKVSGNGQSELKIMVDNAMVSQVIHDKTSNWQSYSGIKQMNFTDGDHTVKLRFGNLSGNTKTNIRNCRIDVLRIK